MLKPKEVLISLQGNEEAYNTFRKAKANYDAASVVGFIGGFLVGWPLGTTLAGGDPQWGLAVAGGALVLLTIPMTSAFKKHSYRAIEIYNGSGTAGANSIKST